MTDKELNITLREMAKEYGLCDDWYGQWSDDSTIDECLDRYVRGFDFVQEKDYPPLEFIREHFRRDDLHRHHIYLDEEVYIDAPDSGYYIFLGSCKGKIEINGLKAVTVYVRHDSHIEVYSGEGALVYITVYDDGYAAGHSDGWSRVKMYDRKKKTKK